MDQLTTLSGQARYKLLVTFFKVGCFLNIILTFVPSVILDRGYFFGGEKERISGFQMVQFTFQLGRTEMGLLYVLFFGTWVACLTMAIIHQKRWVFIAGAAVAAFMLLLNLFSPNDPHMELLAEPRLLGYLAGVLMLTGFFVKPPITIPEQL